MKTIDMKAQELLIKLIGKEQYLDPELFKKVTSMETKIKNILHQLETEVREDERNNILKILKDNRRFTWIDIEGTHLLKEIIKTLSQPKKEQE